MHEKTLIHAIHMLGLWSSSFKKCVPKVLVMWFVVSIHVLLFKMLGKKLIFILETKFIINN